MGALTLRRRRDGTVTLESDNFPAKHGFTPRSLVRLLELGAADVEVRMKAENDEALYRLTGCQRTDPEDEGSTVSLLIFERVDGDG